MWLRVVAAHNAVYITKMGKDLQGYMDVFAQLREANQHQISAGEVVMPAEVRETSLSLCRCLVPRAFLHIVCLPRCVPTQVPIDMLGEADGGGGGKGAGSEKLREKQREIERLNALLPKS